MAKIKMKAMEGLKCKELLKVYVNDAQSVNNSCHFVMRQPLTFHASTKNIIIILS